MRLRAVLGDDAYWIPPRLWAYAAENQPDGDFSDYSDEEIASVIGYGKDAPSMLQALLKAGFLEADRKLHDWAAYNGFHASFKERAKNAAKVRWEKERTKEKEKKTGEEKRGDETSIAPSMPQAYSKHPNGEEFKPFSLSPLEQIEADIRGHLVCMNATTDPKEKRRMQDRIAELTERKTRITQ